jgi:hypothetical protein
MISKAAEQVEDPICATPSGLWLAASLIDLVAWPLILLQPGALRAFGTVGLYCVSVGYGAAAGAVIARFTPLRLCPIIWIWAALSCLGGIAVYFAG